MGERTANFNSAKGRFINELLSDAENHNPLPVTPVKHNGFDALKIDDSVNGQDLQKILGGNLLMGTYDNLIKALSLLQHESEEGNILREAQDIEDH